MFAKQGVRLFHLTRIIRANAKNSNLGALRKKTGYTFSNCKTALSLHNDDLKLAEEWLHKQAEILGWSKANKLENRSTANGLIGVLIKENIGAMVEINCETDFVARNENFKTFVDQVAKTCIQYTAQTDFDGDLWKLAFEKEALMHLKFQNDKPLRDLLALLIGKVGENASIRRAICFKTKNDIQLSSYTHPSSNDKIANSTEFGKYGTILAIRSENHDEILHKSLCQHILGFCPQKIGEEGTDLPMEDKDSEKCLIFQEYLLDSNLRVGEVLKENKVAIVDYQRFECGEIKKVEND